MNLVLHSLAPLVSIAAVMFTPGADAVMTYNVAMPGCVVLNLWSAYALAWRVSRDRLAAVFAAIALAAAPILLVRTYGHLNLAAAWVLPLLLLAVVRCESSPDWRRAMVVSACLAGAAYTDYYYAIFGVIAAFIHTALWRVPISLTTCPLTRARRIAVAILASAIALLATVLEWIVATGGTTAEIAGQRLSVTGTLNLRVAIGLLATTALFVWKRPIFVHASNVTPVGRGPRRLLFVVGGLTLALMTTLLMAATSMWRAGDYISQAYVWRNAPAGVDLATAVLGNHMSPLTGGWTTALYESVGIDSVESVAWLGFAPLAMAVLALRQAAIDRRVHTYAWIGVFFFVWSLGPYLQVFGWNTAAMLPATLVRFVPVVANARIPGRAFVVVALAVAMLGAVGLASLRRSKYRPLVLAVLALFVIDIWPTPHPLVEVPRPPIYDRLREQPNGVVLEVPSGYRDGFGERGRLGHWTLAYQTQHSKPIVGGFVARLSARIRNAYERDPVLQSVLDASEGRPVALQRNVCSDSVTCVVRYVVLDRETASPSLVALGENTFALREIDSDGTRTIFAVEGVRTCVCTGVVPHSAPQ